MAVNYDAGRGGRGAYANLARALQMKLEAENSRRAEDIRRQGLFGTGITQENLSSLANTGLSIAQFGQDRMDKQMASATDSFNRRMERNQKLYDRYASSTDPNDQKKADMLLMNMNREQDRFEDAMREYGKSGMFGTGFGSDVVDYDVDESGFLQNLVDRVNAKPATASSKRRSSVRGGRAFGANRVTPQNQQYQGSGQTPNASPVATNAPQDDEFGGRGTTPLMSQRVMPDRGMEGNTGQQSMMVPTTATMTGEALGPKNYEDYLKTADPMPFPPLNEAGTHDQRMYPSWREEEDRRQLMKKTKRFYDPAQFTTR